MGGAPPEMVQSCSLFNFYLKMSEPSALPPQRETSASVT